MFDDLPTRKNEKEHQVGDEDRQPHDVVHLCKQSPQQPCSVDDHCLLTQRSGIAQIRHSIIRPMVKPHEHHHRRAQLHDQPDEQGNVQIGKALEDQLEVQIQPFAESSFTAG